LFILTIFAAVRAVDPDTKCSINRFCLYVLKRLFRMPIVITFLGYLGQPLILIYQLLLKRTCINNVSQVSCLEKWINNC